MLKNVALKKTLKSTIFRGLTCINKVVKKDDRIVILYSANREINGTLKAIKDYLLENGYDRKYRIVCVVPSMKYAGEDTDRVEYITQVKSFFLFLKAAHVFYTTGQIPIKPVKEQKVIYVDHGSAKFKRCGAMTNIDNGDEFFFTHCLATSPLYIPIFQQQFLCEESNVLICGEACTDILYGGYRQYELGNFDKILLWAPTFRQSDFYGYADSSEELLPMFTENEYEELNEVLKKYNFKLIVKIHPGQDMSRYSKLSYSNLMIYSDSEFKKTGMELYNLMAQVDYLLADYSSVFLQFLLLDKPIGFVVPDFEEYKQKRGFVFDNPLDYMPGDIIKTKQELYDCFGKWYIGEDAYSEQRKIVRDQVHTFQDGKNAKRTVECAGMNL